MPDQVRSAPTVTVRTMKTRQQIVALRGTPAVVGLAAGSAFVARDATVEPGFRQILVVETFAPAFLPLLTWCSALVVERGRLTANAVIVARELGIPAVTDLEHATRFIRTGDRVFVDAYYGAVSIG